ncbi:unnamed protein product [Mytilus edulis]|uniref:Uncharacterized protein n=1 Tax=Mytilus edulis TaxID=6550 RepID=A0A8S3RVN8_MYTED|nr:unnamed protein product [Mytilus edulis]
MQELVKGPTCFKKGCNPSLVDVIITNKKNLCFKTINSPNGVSDCHNIISTVVKGNLPAQKRRDVTYRSYKTFDIDEFTNDLQKIKISENCNEKDLNRIYDDYEEDFKNILNKHAPVKSRGQRNKPLPLADKIGADVVYDPSNHPSIKEILDNRKHNSDFEFKKVSNENVEKILNKINIKKATGADGIPAKIVKNCKSYIAPQLTTLVNLSIDNNCFPR